MQWMKRLTQLLQRSQTALYSARHIELMSKEAKARRDRYLALRRRTKSRRTQTLFEAWRIPYYKPAHPRRLFTAPAPPLEPVQSTALQP
jgi:hypothetical protein